MVPCLQPKAVKGIAVSHVAFAERDGTVHDKNTRNTTTSAATVPCGLFDRPRLTRAHAHGESKNPSDGGGGQWKRGVCPSLSLTVPSG